MPYTPERSFIAVLEAGQNTKLAAFRKFLADMWLVKLDVGNMAASSPREALWLERDASNFASWYRYLLQESPEAVTESITLLRDVLPGFRSLKAMASGRAKVLTASFSWPGRADGLFVSLFQRRQFAIAGQRDREAISYPVRDEDVFGFEARHRPP